MKYGNRCARSGAKWPAPDDHRAAPTPHTRIAVLEAVWAGVRGSTVIIDSPSSLSVII
jgi:hypothetical protein